MSGQLGELSEKQQERLDRVSQLKFPFLCDKMYDVYR